MDEHNKAITQSEEKELQRVFTTMCNYLPKSKIFSKLNPKRERRDKIVQYKKNPETIVLMSKTKTILTEDEVNKEYETLKTEIHALEREMQQLDMDSHRKIKAGDLNECLRSLGKNSTRKEIEDMIWEVDEDLDGMVDWDEFKLTYQRNLADTTGLEPCQLFNVIQFMLYDKDGSGNVTVDETMHMLYTRYGKEKLEGQMKLLFGEDLATQDGDGELSFVEYLAAVGVKNKKQFTEEAKKKKKNKN